MSDYHKTSLLDAPAQIGGKGTDFFRFSQTQTNPNPETENWLTFVRVFDVHRILDTYTLTLYCPAYHTFFSPVSCQQDSTDTMIEPGHLPDDIEQFTLGHEKSTTESSVPATPKESRLSLSRTKS